MRGYILHLQKHKDEDLIVTILCETKILRLYRFYGVRHSPLQIGHKIDFVYESDAFFMPRLRDISHLGFSWLFDLNRVRVWQQFMLLLHSHLKGVDQVDSYYLEVLEKASKDIELQNPKRVLIEAATKIFRHEGRLRDDFCCLVCEDEITSDQMGVVRAFLPVHHSCIYSDGFSKDAIFRLFSENETTLLDDGEIDRLWRVIEEGL